MSLSGSSFVFIWLIPFRCPLGIVWKDFLYKNVDNMVYVIYTLFCFQLVHFACMPQTTILIVKIVFRNLFLQSHETLFLFLHVT
jgi:hypothetical protein